MMIFPLTVGRIYNQMSAEYRVPKVCFGPILDVKECTTRRPTFLSAFIKIKFIFLYSYTLIEPFKNKVQ